MTQGSFSSRFAFSLFARPLNPSGPPLGFIHCRDNECDSEVEVKASHSVNRHGASLKSDLTSSSGGDCRGPTVEEIPRFRLTGWRVARCHWQLQCQFSITCRATPLLGEADTCASVCSSSSRLPMFFLLARRSFHSPAALSRS